MAPILPAGQHNGTLLRKWTCDAFTISEVQYAARAKYAWHGNEHALLVVTEKGCCAKQTDRKEVVCAEDSLLFIPAQRLQADLFSTDTVFLIVDISPLFIARSQELGAIIRNVVSLPGAEFVGFGSQLVQEFQQMDSVSPLVFESLILSILANGFRAYSSSLRPKVPNWLLMAKDLLHDRLTESFTIESIADEVGIHPVRLSHEFRRFFKVTPGEYLRHIRVDFAAKQLTDTTCPLLEIAMASGFADQAHFSRTFRRITHMTPSAFRGLATSRRKSLIPYNSLQPSKAKCHGLI
jgi:AraC family transcriptional regulator